MRIVTVTTLVLSISIMAILAGCISMTSHAPKEPVTIGFPLDNPIFATFLNPHHAGNRIGYRFFEHLPLVWGEVPADAKSARIDPRNVERLEMEFQSQPGLVKFEYAIEEDGWVPQTWIFYMVPREDGIELLWTIETYDHGLNTYYAVQQCFRMSGRTNGEWRRKVAETPAFSEYDLWAEEEARGGTLTSLAYVVRNGHWEALPAKRTHSGCRTPQGVAMDMARTNGDLSKITGVDPYGPTEFSEPADCGLATRSDIEGQWVSAVYWERTVYITDHHPADCLHPIVNIGPIPAHGKRAIRGRIYWMQATKEQLLKRWKKDF